jgi:spermidine synthase
MSLTTMDNNGRKDVNNNNAGRMIRGIQNGWFTETDTMWPGQRFSLALRQPLPGQDSSSILFHETSEFQEILVFRSSQYGKVFVIDGILQLTERDAFCFHEMMAHLPLFAHHSPSNVLIVGGGDGVVLQEVCRHEEVQKIVLVEIDPMVIKASRECLQLVPDGVWKDPRLEVVHMDAAEYVQTCDSRFDIILADTLDPLGPAESLFEPEFYEAMHTALRPNGIVCTQGENFWIHFDLIRDLVACCSEIFDRAEYATTAVPSYPCGQIGFILARKGNGHRGRSGTKSCSVPVRTPSFQEDLKWYNPQMHRAAFVLPHFVKVELNASDVNFGRNYFIDECKSVEQEEEGDRCFLAGCTIQ